MRPCVYIFGWPGFVGGADTKLHHLLLLLHDHCEFTLVPNEERHLKEETWTRLLDGLGVRYMLLDDLPPRLEGFALSLCNDSFFSERMVHRANDKGLKVVWSGGMMWHHKDELEAFRDGVVDQVLYVSEIQRSALASGHGAVPWRITGNYIDPAQFPFAERRHGMFAIGRLSRAATEKYPEDFPVFYERLLLPETRFRVMAWDVRLAHKYRWHRFDERWDLLAAGAEGQVDFLHSLDLFVYPLGPWFVESWGRSTVEAMLTGCVPLVPAGHHLENLLMPGETGYVCGDFLEWKEHAQKLRHDYPFRRRMSHQCREHAVRKLCNREEHLRVWLEVFGAGQRDGALQTPDHDSEPAEVPAQVPAG